MPDAIFADPRLTPLYDAFESTRGDLTNYLHIARELRATSVVDVGCGTGAFALLAANEGLHVTGVDPAAASLDVARAKPGAEQIDWHLGDATTLPAVCADLVVMTGNVAQVFLTDDSWSATLAAVHTCLVPGGHFVYETRQLSDRAWERWAADTAATVRTIDGIGDVTQRTIVEDIELPLITFRHEYDFPSGDRIISTSTLRFRSDQENRTALQRAGFYVSDVREAPDRPGRENVYIASTPD
ncbi:MAG: class I SAM-dependent methyltransferase [Actinomycetota bacterium]|nr:class I SAM-dependent methyltransferase [Actinomycetota bacterium]